jgi:hypothetical protein
MQKISTLFLSLCIAAAAMAQQAQVQFINNAADTIMKSVKISMNDEVKLDSLAYRKATPFISVSGDSTYTVLFTSNRNTAKTVMVTQTLDAGKKYVFVLNGVTNDTTFEKNPDSIGILLHIVVIDQSAFTAPASDQTVLAVVNGSTDAPAFDLYSNDTLNILYADNDSLNQVREAMLSSSMVKLRLTTADGGFLISKFLFDLSGLGGQITTALTTGFFAPGSNQNGPNFSIYLVDSSGNIINTQNVSVIKNNRLLISDLLVFPNPATEYITLNFMLEEETDLQWMIYSVKGEQVYVSAKQAGLTGKNEQRIQLPELTGGMYFLQLQSEQFTTSVRFLVK